MSGSVDKKLYKEIRDLNSLCEGYKWDGGILVIDDPNKVMKSGQAYLDKNSDAYKDIRKNFPYVEVITLFEFRKRFYDKLSYVELIALFGKR